MKTLDEVINELNYWDTCDAFPESFYDFEVTRDALHYLKLLKTHCDRVQNQIEDLREEYRPNDPLTWDELKAMTGKPVWVEYRRSVRNRWGHRCWHIIRNIQRVQFDRIDTEWLRVDEDGVYFDKADLGKTWQAYRKERK